MIHRIRRAALQLNLVGEVIIELKEAPRRSGGGGGGGGSKGGGTTIGDGGAGGRWTKAWERRHLQW